jgi:hypothetical protein
VRSQAYFLQPVECLCYTPIPEAALHFYGSLRFHSESHTVPHMEAAEIPQNPRELLVLLNEMKQQIEEIWRTL